MQRLDSDGTGEVDFEEYLAWRSNYSQFGHDFSIKDVFTTGPAGFSNGVKAGFQLLGLQIKRSIERDKLRAAKRQKDKAGATGRRVARMEIVRSESLQ